MSMTLDERAAACLQHMDRVMMTRSQKPSEIIAQYIREAVEEAVSERDKLLAECLTWLRHCNVGDSCQEQITAMIGEQA